MEPVERRTQARFSNHKCDLCMDKYDDKYTRAFHGACPCLEGGGRSVASAASIHLRTETGLLESQNCFFLSLMYAAGWNELVTSLAEFLEQQGLPESLSLMQSSPLEDEVVEEKRDERDLCCLRMPSPTSTLPMELILDDTGDRTTQATARYDSIVLAR